MPDVTHYEDNVVDDDDFVEVMSTMTLASDGAAAFLEQRRTAYIDAHQEANASSFCGFDMPNGLEIKEAILCAKNYFKTIAPSEGSLSSASSVSSAVPTLNSTNVNAAESFASFNQDNISILSRRDDS